MSKLLELYEGGYLQSYSIDHDIQDMGGGVKVYGANPKESFTIFTPQGSVDVTITAGSDSLINGIAKYIIENFCDYE